MKSGRAVLSKYAVSSLRLSGDILATAVYINNDSKSVIVGIHEGEYDEKTAEEEAKKAAEYGFKYFQSLKEPVSSLKVVYCNAGDQSKIYGSFDFNAE